jgi:hypothetical protein
MKTLEWKLNIIPNFGSRFLPFSLLVFSVMLISSCDSKATISESGICVGKPGTGVTGNCSSSPSPSANSPTPQAEPIKYSVVCFAQNYYSSRCQDTYYKIPEGVSIEVYLEKTGGGISENVGYKSMFKVLDGKQEIISKSESDMLVNNGAKAYSIGTLHVHFFDSSKNEFISVPGFQKQEQISGNYNFIEKIRFTTGDTFKIINMSFSERDTNPDWICGAWTSSCTVTKLVPYKSISTITEASSPSQESSHPSAAEFIQTYYQLLNERNYSNSWGKLSTNFQQRSQDYKQWWDKVKNIRVSSVKNISQDENMATVEAQISYELKDGRVKQDDNKQIHLIWNKTKNEWEIDK